MLKVQLAKQHTWLYKPYSRVAKKQTSSTKSFCVVTMNDNACDHAICSNDFNHHCVDKCRCTFLTIVSYNLTIHLPFSLCVCSLLSQEVVTPLFVRPVLVRYSTSTAVMWMDVECTWVEGWGGGGTLVMISSTCMYTLSIPHSSTAHTCTYKKFYCIRTFIRVMTNTIMTIKSHHQPYYS